MKCENCNSENIVLDDVKGENVCCECGIVQTIMTENLGDRGKFITPNEDNYGSPMSTVLQSSDILSSNIGMKDVSGRSLKPEISNTFTRMRKIDSRSKMDRPGPTIDSLQMMRNITMKMGLSEHIYEDAVKIYKKIYKNGGTRGRNIEALLVGIIYVSCRENHAIRTLSDFAHDTPLSKNDISRNVRFILKTLDIKPPRYTIKSLVGALTNKLGIDGKVRVNAINTASKIEDNGSAVGRQPNAVAAAIVYSTCKDTNQKVTQNIITRTSHISSITLRNIINALNL